MCTGSALTSKMGIILVTPADLKIAFAQFVASVNKNRLRHSRYELIFAPKPFQFTLKHVRLRNHMLRAALMFLMSPSAGAEQRVRRRRDRAANKVGRCGAINGFTLIELLVVVAIIGVLASLLVGTVSRAKQTSDSAVCRNNLRQQAIALSVYASDFALYPTYCSGVAPAPRFWMDSLSGYVGGSKWPARNWMISIGSSRVKITAPRKSVFTCPGYDREVGFYDPSMPSSDGEGYTHGFSGAYGYNGGVAISVSSPFILGGLISLDGGLGGTNATNSARENDIVNPSRLIATGDAQMWRISIAGAGPGVNAPEMVGGFSSAPHFLNVTPLVEHQLGFKGDVLSNEKAMLRRHGGKWHMGFCDGHVEAGRPLKFFNFHSEEVVKLWRRDNGSKR